MLIREGDLTDHATIAFLQAHVDQLRATSPPESTHVLDLDGLRRDDVRFWSAHDEDGSAEIVGCAALKRLDAFHAELKSMRTAPHRRGEGIAARLVEYVLDQARLAGYARVSLETGSQEFFAPARRLYLRHGFEPCEPFGSYRPDPHSAFFTREL